MDELMQCFPEAMTQVEKLWLATALKLDFRCKDIILEQLSKASIERAAYFDSTEVFFNDIPDGARISPSQGAVLFINVYRPDAVYIEAELIAFDGKVDSFYIYAPDGSELVLSDIPLDDVSYSVYAYMQDADALIRRLYSGADLALRAHGKSDALLSREEQMRPKVEKAFEEIIARIAPERCSFGAYDIGPLSMSLCFSLGSDGEDTYEVLVRCSLVGCFSSLYVIKNGVDHAFERAEPEGRFKMVRGTGIIR